MPRMWIHGLHTLSPLWQVAQDIPAGNSVCLVPPDILPYDAPCSVDDEDCGCCQPIVEAVVGVVCPRDCAVAVSVEDGVRDTATCPWYQGLRARKVVHADSKHFRAALSDLGIVIMQLN